MKAGSLVTEASAALQSWLETSGFQPGARIPSERQIATELGQTHWTTNRVVTRLVAEGLLSREGYKLYYVSSGKPVRSDAPYFYTARKDTPRIKVVRRIARSMKKKLEVLAWESLESLNFILHRLHGKKTSGLLFDVPFSSEIEKWRPALEGLAASQRPYVCICQPVPGLCCVSPDYGSAVKQAFEHLRQLQHREIAFVSSQIQAPSIVDALEHWEMQCARHELHSSRPRIHFCGHQPTGKDIREFADLLARGWKNVTALIAHNRDVIPLLIDELGRRHKKVPRDLSIICLGDTLRLKTSTPPVSCLSFDESLQIETAFHLLDWIAEREATPGFSPAHAFSLQPHLILRGSTSAREAKGISGKPAKRRETADHAIEDWPTDPVEIRYRIEAIQRRPYLLTAGTGESRFRPIDLREHLNRPLNYRLGWLGDLPLRNLGSGNQRIHGVVFNIVNGRARTDYGAVVFHSLTNNTGAGKPLPKRIKVPVNAFAKAIYILHGCGTSDWLERFAVYRFYTRAGLAGSVPMIALGAQPPKSDEEQLKIAVTKANIQDWWPDYHHTDFAHTKQMIVSQDAETFEKHRYLYTLEWVNPNPAVKIEYVEIQAEPKRSTTLGLIAMSVLLPEGSGP